MADSSKDRAAADTPTADSPPKVETDVKTADLGVSTPQAMQVLAEDLPEKDAVQKAHKEALLADSPQAEVKAQVKIVDESPNAAETPSGAALKKVAGVGNDTERGERYAREKTAVRWGYVPVDES
jgi:hypothetical protein